MTDKKKHWLLDREIPKWSTKIGNTKVEFTLGGRVPDGWTIRDFLWFIGFLAAFAIPLILLEVFGVYEWI